MRLRPSHTTVRTGPYTAVREVALTRAEQGWETERSEVRIGKPSGEGSGAGKIPWPTAAAGRVPCSPFRDPIRDKSRAATPWCFPLAPKSGPQSQPDPASESDQHLGRLAKAEIAAPACGHCAVHAEVGSGPTTDPCTAANDPWFDQNSNCRAFDYARFVGARVSAAVRETCVSVSRLACFE